ncbi:hypothetical protein PanWU01x14_282050 [Parasponia andersonii]|uniref:Uncharacterized protein n=1 Tax=Parasponia andersonii TaxID=3476 RepID=A0A2P5B0U2_PARAD|nr:hypothetical protein PanWU01x14_282050 [Parasponia andersonii]
MVLFLFLLMSTFVMYLRPNLLHRLPAQRPGKRKRALAREALLPGYSAALLGGNFAKRQVVGGGAAAVINNIAIVIVMVVITVILIWGMIRINGLVFLGGPYTSEELVHVHGPKILTTFTQCVLKLVEGKRVN